MRRVAPLILVLLALAAAPAPAQQDDISVEATLSADSITEEDILQLIISISAPQNISDVDVQLPPLRDFDKVGENTSSQFSQINMEIHYVLRYIYNLRPKRRGTFTIPSVTVKVAGSVFTTEPLIVTVTASQSGDEIILRQRIDRADVYVGQQIILTTELLFRVNVLGYDVIEEPAPEGFVVQRDETLKQVTLEEIEFHGQTYYRAVLGRQILFPLSPGSKTIKPPSFQIEYRPRSFGLQTKLAHRTAEAIAVDVKLLPAAGQPEGFDGAVGNYQLKWSASDTRGRVNEPLTITVELSGEGDIERAPDARPPLPRAFELINSSSEQNAGMRNGRWSGRKRWEFIVIPNRAGDVSIGPLSYPFFDPEAGRYSVASVDPIKLAIGPPVQAPASTAAAVSEAETSEWDIRYIKTPAGPLEQQGQPFFHSTFFWAAILLPLLANARIFAGSKLLRRGRGRPLERRRRKALGAARKALERAAARRDPASLSAAIAAYFSDKLDLADEIVSMADIRAALVRRDLHEHPLVVEITSIVEACDATRYAPAGSEPGKINELAGRASRALTALEELL
jgi:hypothetical protein